VTIMRISVVSLLLAGVAACGLWPSATSAQPMMLTPMSVENYRVLQRVSRNGGWSATAYRNYMVGLFEGVLSSEGDATGDRHGKLFCLPPGRERSSIAADFEWLENELNTVVARAQPNALVARIFIAHLTERFPCQR
jgi:hypothetical protein